LDTSVIYCGDNLDVLRKYFPANSVDLIYIDPPFNSSRNYEVFWGEAQEKRLFQDRHGSVLRYMDWMRPRLLELYRVLRPSGTFFYHCDWHASHYIKEELDQIFGPDNFINEIIWKRQSAHNDGLQGAKHLGRLHESIFLYAKGKGYTWNQLYQPYDPAYLGQFYRHVEADTGRRYQLSDITAPGGAAPSKGNPQYEFLGITRYWRFSRERMQQLYEEGRIVQTAVGTVPRQKRYLDEMPGVALQDIWTDIRPVSSQKNGERLGWPTQKPIALLDRIVKLTSKRGDVVLDTFCGCGTTLEASVVNYRKWIGIDSSPTACRVMVERLENLGLHEDEDFELRDMPRTEADLKRMPPFEFENWAVIALGGRPNKVQRHDYGVDGRLYVADLPRPRKTDAKQGKLNLWSDHDDWYPIQVKQRDRIGRDDIDRFETAMRRDKRTKGYFVAFGFGTGAQREIHRAQEDGLEIVPLTVSQILEYEGRIA